MVNFKSRNELIRNADRITRSVNSIYPHISESKSKYYIEHFCEYNCNENVSSNLRDVKLKYSLKINRLRCKHGNGVQLFKDIINMLKINRIGNCYEKSIVAEIIGKINGIENIYPAKIFFNRNNSGCKMQLDHAVAIITNKPFEKGIQYKLKNKDAIVIDPWLGITEFAEDFITKIKHNFIDYFPNIPDYQFMLNLISKTTHDIDKFKMERKKLFKPDFTFLLHDEEILPKESVAEFKSKYSELILDKFDAKLLNEQFK